MMHEPQSCHTVFHTTEHPGFSVMGLPAFNDNYIWVVKTDSGDAGAQKIAVVDPGDAAPVIDLCRRHGLTPSQIWLTHHHADHVGGVAELVDWVERQAPGEAITIYGPAVEEISCVNQALEGGERFQLGGIPVEVRSVPGHTRGHLAYLAGGASGAPALFSGDLLFGLGCGRLFEGTAAQMYTSLSELRALPMHTRVYCAHEYTLLNLPFALAVDPQNPTLAERGAAIRRLRQAGEPTVPLTLGEECETNPFLRSDQTALRASAVVADDASAVDVFARLRQMRDTFKAS